MRPKPESRREISDAIKRRGQNLDDRLERLGLVVQDKRTVCDTAKQLRLATTSEGVEEIRRAIADAAKATGKEFQRQNADAEAAMVQCNQAVKDLRIRMKDAKQNEAAMRSTADHTKESKSARSHIVHGQREARRDAHYLDDAAKSQGDSLHSAAQRRDQQRQTMRNTTLDSRVFAHPTAPVAGDVVREPPPNYGVPDDAGKHYKRQLLEFLRRSGDRGAARNLEADSIPPDELERLKDLMRRSQEGQDASDRQQMPPLPMDGRGYIKEVDTYKNKNYE